MSIALFSIIALIMSAIIHEYMHGWMAHQLGDSTAKDAGRLTLNPIPHIDPIGSILLPFMFYFTTGFVFGWAKPVPFNPHYLNDPKYGEAKVAIAGPLANLIVALVFGFTLRFFSQQLFSFNPVLLELCSMVVYINLLLMVFNLIPTPPLDGSKVLMPFLPYSWQVRLASLERYGMFLVFFFMMFAFNMIRPIIEFLFKLIIGI